MAATKAETLAAVRRDDMMTDPFNEAAASRKELIAEDDASGRIDAWLTAALGAEFSAIG